MGALSNFEIEKLIRILPFPCVAMGIEMALFRKGATRLTTRVLDADGRVYTQNRNKVSHFEEEGCHYFTDVPGEGIASMISKVKKYEVFSYGNNVSPQFFARYLNCIQLHMMHLKVPCFERFKRAVMEIYIFYRPLFVGGLATVGKDEDSFVISNGVMTAIICPDNFEILVDQGELAEGDPKIP